MAGTVTPYSVSKQTAAATGFNIPALKREFLQLWNEAPDTFPKSGTTFTPEEQRRNGEEADRQISETLANKKDRAASMNNDPEEQERMLVLVKTSFGRIFRLPRLREDGHFLREYLACGREFIARTRKFDPALSGEEIYQALRNIWIVNSLQTYIGQPAVLTDSAFAYSLLYPYTDNYLDDPAIPADQKALYTAAVRKLLLGEPVRGLSGNIGTVARLISMIEGEYPRAEYPHVYQSLLAIHRGQERSLTEQSFLSPSLSTADLLEISVEKGGSSVLADGYVAGGELGGEMIQFSFGLGVALQLLDDLQDAEQDERNKHHTIFTEPGSAEAIEQTTNKLFNFIDTIFGLYDCREAGDADALRQLSLQSCQLLGFEAIARSAERYSGGYMQKSESYSPFGFEDLRKLRGKIENVYRSSRNGRGLLQRRREMKLA